VFVEDHNAVGAGFDDAVGALLGEPTHVRDAHLGLGEAADDGDGLVAAGGVAAGATVELVLFAGLAGHFEHAADGLFGDGLVVAEWAEAGVDALVGRGFGRFALVCVGVVQHVASACEAVAGVEHGGAVDAALGAH